MIQGNRKYRYSLLIVVVILAGFLFAGSATDAANWAAGLKTKLNPPVTTRDDKGVWHIKGEKDAPLYSVFEAMGYAVATDRLWQSEKYRRMGRGRLAEVFGPSQLESDIKVRTTGYSDQEYKDGFAALDQESKDTINGYVAGFNRRIAEVKKDRSQLPFEFKALGAKLGFDFVPEEWSYIDVLAWATNMLRFFDCEATTSGQLGNAALIQELGAKYPGDFQKMFQDLRWMQDPDAVTYIKDETLMAENLHKKVQTAAVRTKSLTATGIKPVIAENKYDFKKISRQMREKEERIVANLKKVNAFVKMGSYAWVVSGKKTASGNPIIYSGPQMDHAFHFSVPSIVAEGSIKAGGLDISGMVIPGMPAIVIGRTPHHAWSMQVGHAHTLDYFIDDASMLRLDRIETIKIAGQDDYTLKVYRTPHGPVINADPVISWKYAHWGHEFEIVGTYLALARAQSMDQFGAAIRKVSLSQHYCYADRDGNIAYWMSGFDPVRAAGADPRFPQKGGVAEWPEPVTLKPLATDRNPANGYYGGWNSKASLEYANSPNNPSYYFGPFHRAHVIDDYLASHDNLTFADVRNLALYIATTDSIRNDFLQSDNDSYGDGGNPWKFVKNDFIAAVEAAPTDSRNAALALLADWDGHFVAGGPENWAFGPDRADAWILMNQWVTDVLKMTFFDELGDTQRRVVLFNVLLHGLPGYPTSIANLYDWFSNKVDPNAPQVASEIIVAALDNALAALGDRPWGVAKRGQMTYTHEMLGALHPLPTSSRSTYAHCVEMGPSGPVRIESMFPLGESGTILMDDVGHPVFDPNFFSMSPAYDGFQHREYPCEN